MSDLEDFAQSQTDATSLGKLIAEQAKTKEARLEAARLQRALNATQAQLEEARALLDRFAYVRAEDTHTPKWLRTPKGKKQTHHATPVLMLSDLHLDEVVDLEEMDGMNSYDRAIAERRVTRIVETVPYLLKSHVNGVELDGLLVAILGDIITGVIHDELARTNEAPPAASIAYWVPVLASALVYLADELDIPIHVAGVDGNHDRDPAMGRRTAKKQRAESSLAWIIYNWMADHLRDDPRITFSITVSPEQLIDVYDTTLLLSHGDSFRSAGGVGGLYPSMLKWLLKRHALYANTRRDFDYALIGHWHQTLWGQDFFVNGSLKGYDEYAKDGGFGFERPQQQLFLVTPERGVGHRLTVQAD